MLGDFNEWMRGLATTLLSEKLNSVDLRDYLPRKRTQRTYPGLFPILHLDHIYYAGKVEIVGVELPRTRLVAGRVGSPAARRGCANRIDEAAGSQARRQCLAASASQRFAQSGSSASSSGSGRRRRRSAPVAARAAAFTARASS